MVLNISPIRKPSKRMTAVTAIATKDGISVYSKRPWILSLDANNIEYTLQIKMPLLRTSSELVDGDCDKFNL